MSRQWRQSTSMHHLAKCKTGSSSKQICAGDATSGARLNINPASLHAAGPPAVAAAARQTCFVAVPKHGAVAAEWALHSAIRSEQEAASLIVP